jgi:hypothetical protein
MATKKTKKKAASPRAAASPAAMPAAVAPANSGGGMRLKLVLAVLLVLALGYGYKSRLSSGPSIQLVQEGPLSSRGTGPGQVLGCRHMAMDAEGNAAWVFGGGDEMRVQKFNSRGAFLALYKERNKAEVLHSVNSMAFAPNGSLWLCERGTGRVVQLDKNLKFVSAFTCDQTELTGVAVDPAGDIWVSARSARIDVYDPRGKLQREFKGSPQVPVNDVYRLAIDGAGAVATIDGQREIGQLATLSIFEKDGAALASFKIKGKLDDSACLAWDPISGYLVTNVGGLKMFDRHGKLKGTAVIPEVPAELLVPGLAIGGNGSWLLDMTSQGSGGIFYRPVLPEKPVETKK